MRTWTASSVSFHDACTCASGGDGGVHVPWPRDELAGVIAVVAFAEQEDDAAALAGLQHAPDVKRRARIERRADLAGQRRLAQGGRL